MVGEKYKKVIVKGYELNQPILSREKKDYNITIYGVINIRN